MTCTATALRYTTSLDQIQRQVLNKGKQAMQLEDIQQKNKNSYGGVGPTTENCSLWYPEKHWSLRLRRGRGTPVWRDVKGESQGSREIWHVPARPPFWIVYATCREDR